MVYNRNPQLGILLFTYFIGPRKTMASLLELAKMAEAVYGSSYRAGSVLNGWSCLQFRRASGALSGFQGGIFSRGSEKVVAFRGTDQGMDVVADLKLGTGMNSTYFDLGEQLASLATGGNVTVTGHSLGGAIAQVVANRTGHLMATFNAPGVGVIASRNISPISPMNAVRLSGMVASVARHPIQAARDVSNAFRVVNGINLCLQNDAVSRIGNHYGRVLRIPGTSANPLTEHGIGTVISVLENSTVGSRSPSSF